MATEKSFSDKLYKYSIIPQILLIAALFYMYNLYVQPTAVALIYAFISFCAIVVVLRMAIPSNHRKGVSYLKKKDFERAFREFERSFAFFSRHRWIDKYRFVVLLSSSKTSYTEMALLNLGFCSAQVGKTAQAKEYYKKAIDLFHGSEFAEQSLAAIEQIEKSEG